MENEQLKTEILRKMLRHRWIGGKHTSTENLPKGFPPNLKNQIHDLTKELIKESYIQHHPTNYGIQVSINPAMIIEIKKRCGLV